MGCVMKRKYFYVFGLVFSLLLASCNIGLGEAIDTESPKIDITSPNEGAIIRDKFAIKGTYSDDGQIKSIVLNLNNLVTGDSKTYDAIYSENAYSFTIDPLNEGIKDGNYLANVTITDTYGHVTHVSSPYTIDNTAPVIILSRPESKKGSESFEMFGQEFKLEGRAHDDNEIEIEVQVFSKDDEEKPLLTKTLKNVNRSIELTVLDAKNALEDYEKVYGKISTEENETKDLYCKIIAKDSSKRYPVSEEDISPTDNEGNKIETYYLESEFEEVIRASYSATDLYKMINGTFDASGRQVDESIKIEDIQKLLANNKVTYGQFSLNPANNPSYEVTNFNAPLNKDGKDFEGEDYKLTRGSSITVKVNSGLDGTYILGKSLGVYVSECDDEGKILDKENKIWLIEPEIDEDGNTRELTEEQIAIRKAALETQLSVEKSKSYTFKSIELKASRSGMMLGKKYLIFVSGYDTNKTKVSNFNKDYGFYFAPKDAAPTLTVTEPSANTTYLAKGATLKVSGTSKTEMGNPTIEILVNGKEVEGIEKADLEITENEDLSNISKFEYEIPASAFDQKTSNEYLVSIVAKLEGKETVKEKTVSYDVDIPEILIQSVNPVVAKNDKKCVNKTINVKGSISDSFTGLQTNTLKYYVLQEDEEKLSGAITMPSNFTVEIDTEKLTDEKEMILKLYAEDKAGNVSEITETYFVDQSTDIPNVGPNDESWDAQIDSEQKLQESIVAGNKNNIFTSGGSIVFNIVDDDGISVVTVNDKVYKLNGSPLETSVSYVLPTSSGRNKLDVTVEDIFGVEKKLTVWVQVTGAAPKVTLRASPEYFSRNTNKVPGTPDKITISGVNEGADPFKIDVLGEKTDYSSDVITGSDDKNVNWTHSFVPKSKDINKIKYKVSDYWGIFTETEISFKEDSESPVVEMPDSNMPTVAATEASSFKFKGTSSDVGSVVEKVQVSFDGIKWQDAVGTNEWSYTSIFAEEKGFETEGEKTIHVRNFDTAGNYSVALSKTFVFDKAVPQLIVSSPTQSNLITTANITFSGKAWDSYGLKENDSVEIVAKKGDTVVKTYKPTVTLATSEPETTNWSQNISDLVDGKYTIEVKATDKTGKVSVVSKKEVTIDSKKPTATITKVPNKEETEKENSKFSGTANDEGTGIKNIQISFDGTNWKEAVGTTDWSYSCIFADDETFAAEGPKTIYVRAYDNAGNYSDVGTKDFVFDKAEPVVAIKKYDNNEISTTQISVQDEFTLSGSATDAYGIESVILEQKKGEASREVHVTFENGIWTTENLPVRDANAEIESGTYVYTVKATDKAGKVSSSTLSVLIDKEGPKVEIVTPDASYLGTAAIDKVSFTFAGRAIEGIGQSGVASYSYAIVGQGEDARNWIEVPSTAENWSFTKNIPTGEEPLAEGKYTLYVKAKDKAGNESAVASRNFDVDLAAPSVEVSLSSGTRATTEYFDSSFNLIGTIADSNGIASVVVKINGEETSIVDEKPNSTSYSLNKEITVNETDGTIKTDGTYNFEVTVTDKVGKTTTKTLSAIVDTKAPTVEFKSHANGNIVTTIPFVIEGTVSDAGSGISTEGGTFVLKQGETEIQSGALTVQANGMWTQKIGEDDTGSLMTTEGDYTIQVSLNDKAGKSSTETVNVVYDKALPQLSVTSGNSVTTNTAFTLSGTASDSYGLKDVTIVVKGKGQGGEEVGETFVPTVNNDSTWTQEITVKTTEDTDGLLKDGSYTVEITATDKANRKSTTQIVSVLVDTQKPDSTKVGVDENKISPNIVVYNLTQIPIKVVANDEGGSGLALVSYSVTPTVENSYNALVLKNGEWTGYVTCDWQGTQNITVKAEDNAGNSLTKTIPVTIDTIAPDTITSSIEGTRLENGTRDVQVEISATDAGNSEGTEPYNSGVASVEIVKIGSQRVSIPGTWDETNKKWTLDIASGEISTGGVTVKVTDNANNSVENTIFTFQLDNEPPSVSITGLSDADSSTEGTQINGTVTLTGTSNDDQGLAETTPVKLYYSKDGGTTYTPMAAVEGTTSWSLDIDTTTAFGSITDGTTLTLKAEAVDKAGNTNSTTTTVIVNQDTDRPIINLSNLDISEMTSGEGIFYKQKVLYGSITDDDGTVQSVKISLDGTTWTENIYNNGTWDYSFAEDGTKTVYFEITDKSGKTFASNGTVKPKLSDGQNKNTEDANLYLRIDTTSPTIPNVWFRTTNPTTVSLEKVPEGASDDEKAEIEAKNAENAEIIKAELETQLQNPIANGWIVGDSLSTTVIGGPESKLYVMYVANDANGIYKTIAKLNSTSEGTQLYESATKESRVVEFSLTGISSGNNKLEIKAHDNASGDSDVGSQARTFDLNVDNTAPEVSFGSLQNIYYGSESNSISGTMRDTNTINELYLGLSKNDTEEPEPSEYLSVDYENRGQNTWTVTFDGGVTNSESTSLHTEVLNKWLDSLYGEGTQNNDAVKDVWLWAYAVDEMGNTSEVEKKLIKVSPQGDKPSVTIEVPAQGDSTGGSVRISGVADIQTSNIDSVWVQIDPSYDTSTGFDNNWKSELETIITGKAVPYSIEENPQYEDESGNKKSISGINGNAAIKANGTSSWNLIINGLKEFQTDGENKLVAVRVYAVSKTGKVSEEDEVSFTIDPKSPRIGNTTPLQLVQYEADGTIKASMNYESGMWIKGTWFLIGSVEDESGISQIYWGEKNSEPRSIMGSDFVREGNPGEVINVTDAAANGAINYMLKIPVGNNTENDFGRLEYYLSVVEGGTDGKDASQNIILNYDNQAPQFTANLDKSGNEIYQSDGTYSVSGTFEETSSGVNNQSGFNRIAMFFERSYTKDGVTTKYLVDPMLEGGDSGTANRYPISEFENKNNLYWRTAEADITNEGIVFDSLPTNVRVGGLCMIKDVIYRIQTVRGNVITIDKPIVNQNDVTVYFALAQVIDNTIVESGLTKAYVAGSEDKEDDDHINGDGDQMIEKANITGSTCNWQASIDSSLIYDGPITIHFVAFDAAGNMTCDDFSGNVSNNAPRIAGVSFGTDNNGDEEISTDEMITAYSGWYDIESPNKQTGVTQNGKKANGQNVSVFNVGYNEYDDKWETSLVVKGNVKVVPEIVGGNTGLGYSVMQGNTSVKEYADYEGVGHSADGEVRDNDLTIELTVADFLSAYEENTDEVDGVKNFTFSIWDKTEGTTAGVDSQHADINIQMNVMLQDTEAPKVSLIPFYWKGKTENSLYQNSRENGHIELEGDLEGDLESDLNGIFNANSGLYDTDPKVSGKITIEGTASDNVLLMELGVKTEYKFKVINETTNEFDNSSYKPIAKRVDGVWTSDATLDNNGWEFEAVEETFSQEGNTLKWKLHLDTEKVEKVAQTDFILYVQAKDRGSAYLDGDKNLKYAYDAPTDKYKPKTAEATRKMDIVPYITGVQTWLVNELKTSIRDAYSRTALGHYIINENEGNIPLTGFNLDGNTTIASSAATTGAYSVSVNGVESLNNKNNNNAKGSYTEEMQESCSYEDKDNFAYNRLANGRTNNLLTDDIYFDVWEFDSDAALPESGKLSEPVMKINPVTGKVGFAFVSGPAHFSMGAGTGNSYETYQRNYAAFSNISFAYDDNGNSYGTATGLDTYPEGETNTQAGRFTFMTSKWGADNTNETDNYSSRKKIRFEAIGLPGDDRCYVKGVHPDTYTMTETRFASPSMAVTTRNDAATVYLAYYDDVQDQIRFRYGTVPNDRKSFNNFVDNKGLGQNGTYDKENNDGNGWNDTSHRYVFESNTANFSLIAGADWQNYANRENANTGLTKKVGNNYFYDTGYEADAYVAIDAIKRTTATGEAADIVVAVWYDGKDCYYAYNTDPDSGKDNGKAGGWTTKKIFSGGGEYCTIKVDSSEGIHIAANVDGALKYAYLSSYSESSSYDEASQAIKIDSCAITGEQINIDVGIKNGHQIPHISYYMSASKKPCIAYITEKAFASGMNYKAAGTDSNDCFTGNWEVSVIPTQTQLSGGHSDKINVGLWKNNGTIVNSYLKNASGVTQDVPEEGNTSGTSSGNVYGNGTANPIFGYAVKSTSGTCIETAQMK